MERGHARQAWPVSFSDGAAFDISFGFSALTRSHLAVASKIIIGQTPPSR